MSKVTLRKTDRPSMYGNRYQPASYDVLVDGRKVARLEGRRMGRMDVFHWHELRDLAGRVILSNASVRGSGRQDLDAAARELAAASSREILSGKNGTGTRSRT